VSKNDSPSPSVGPSSSRNRKSPEGLLHCYLWFILQYFLYCMTTNIIGCSGVNSSEIRA